MKKRRNPNRGIVLGLAEAASIHRWLEFVMDGRKFDNPIVAMEVKQAAEAAKDRLGEKLADVYLAHREMEEDDCTGMTADERAWVG